MGLKAGDLKNLVYDIFEIDSYQSKMGSDKDIVVLSFSCKEKTSADDLMNFLEKGYNFILDADSTPGEQSDGTYKIFAEIQRDKDAISNILEVVDGVEKLSGLSELKFRYYKNFKSQVANQDSLEETMPLDPDNYGIKVNETNLNNYKNFFNKSYIDSIDMLDNTLMLKKIYSDPLAFEFIEFGKRDKVLPQINETFDIMNSYPEIIFLTKYLGDYNICKYGENLVFENKDYALVLKRKTQ
jgi:hypothetical protein